MSRIQLVAPSVTRSGRRFAPTVETLLYPAAIRAATELPRAASDGVIIVPEMQSPIGVPDFVALIGAETALNARLRSGIPPILGQIDLAVIAALSSRRPSRVAAVATRIGVSEHRILPRLRALAGIGAVIVEATGSMRLPDVLEPFRSIYAIEVKRKDWRKAQLQARAYRSWANNYVLVMDELGETASTRAALAVNSDGGGLYLEDRWLVKPRARKQPRQAAVAASEYIVAALEGYQPSPDANA